MKLSCQDSGISLIDDRSIKKRLYFDHIAKIGPVNDTSLLSEEEAWPIFVLIKSKGFQLSQSDTSIFSGAQIMNDCKQYSVCLV